MTDPNKQKSKPNHKQAALTKAAALKYDGQNAPTVVAKGTGALAEQIIEQAKKHDVHLHNDPVLLEVLSRLDLGDSIPQELYLAVAKVIAFAYYLQGKHPAGFKTDQGNSADELAQDSPSIEQQKSEGTMLDEIHPNQPGSNRDLK